MKDHPTEDNSMREIIDRFADKWEAMTLAEQITELFGERCGDYASGCIVCFMWKLHDELVEKKAEFVRMENAWRRELAKERQRHVR